MHIPSPDPRVALIVGVTASVAPPPVRRAVGKGLGYLARGVMLAGAPVANVGRDIYEDAREVAARRDGAMKTATSPKAEARAHTATPKAEAKATPKAEAPAKPTTAAPKAETRAARPRRPARPSAASPKTKTPARPSAAAPKAETPARPSAAAPKAETPAKPTTAAPKAETPAKPTTDTAAPETKTPASAAATRS